MYPSDEYYQKIVEAKNSSFSFPYGPEYVVIDLTNKCNCRCYGCWIYSHNITPTREEKEVRKRTIPSKAVFSFIDSLAKLKTQEVRITGGGEPFLHPDIIPIIKYIKDKHLRCDLTTNFSLVTKEKADALLEAEIDNLTISLWAGDAESYVQTHPTQTKNMFEKIERTLSYFLSHRKKTKVTLANVLSNKNYDAVDSMLSFAKRVGVDDVYFTLLDPIPGKTDQFLLNDEQQQTLVKRFQDIKQHIDSYPFHIDNIDNILRRISSAEVTEGNYDKNIVKHLNCFAGFTFARILANGDVCPCCKSVSIVMGNIVKTPFHKIWNSPQYREFRMQSYHLEPNLVKEVECYKTCDNLMQNIEAYDKVQSIMRHQQ